MGCAGSSTKLSKQDLSFLIENTEFTKQQIKSWYSGFIVDCPSGELTKVKFIEVYQQLFPQGNSQKFCSHIFRTFDTDNSGKIDFKEFLMAINITAKGDPEKKLRWAFKMYDVDGNGEIDKNEMFQIIMSIYDLVGLGEKDVKNESGQPQQQQKGPNGEDVQIESPVVRTEQIFTKMDLDKNGVISEYEFITGCLQDKFLYQMLTADYSDSF